MNKIFMAAISVIAAGIFAIGACYAEEQYSDSNMRVFDGKVASVDTSRSTVTVNGPIQIEFPISSDTELRKDTYGIKLLDINVGDYVTVQYYRSGSESRIPAKVTKVTVESWE